MNEKKPNQDLVIADPPAVAAREDGQTVRQSWNYSADKIVVDTAHYPAVITEQFLALFRWCTDKHHPMHIQDACRRLGCSTQLIYQLFTGRYRDPDEVKKDRDGKEVSRVKGDLKAPSAELMKSIRELLELEAKRFALGGTEFVMIPTARKIITALTLARESQSIVFIWGPSHIGKTWTAEKYFTPNNNHGKTIYCRMKAASGLGGMVRAMAAAAKISDKSNTAALIQRIKDASSPNTLWILDEVHLLANTYRKGSFFACMEVIREIFDETECGMALIFTILDDVKAASQKELQQLWRRGVHKVPLPLMPTQGDLAAILKHNGLEFPHKELTVTLGTVTEQPYEILRQQAKLNGLKAITERIRYAKSLALKSNSKDVTWHHFVKAHLMIERQAEQEPEWS